MAGGLSLVTVAGPAHPAWGVAVMAAGGALLIWANLAVLAARGGPIVLLAVSGGATAVGGAVFIVAALRRASRWRGWMTHAGMVVGEANLLGLVLLAPDPVTTVGFTSSFGLAAAYAGLYLTRRAVLHHVSLLTILAVVAAGLSGAAVALSVAATVVPVCVVLAFFTHQMASVLREQSEIDPLTGLLNRRGLHRRTAELHPRGTGSWTVVIMDLDGFKAVNDASGHDAGDALLRRASHSWQVLLPRQGLLARTGGDEFVLVLPCGREAATGVVEQMRGASPPEVGVSAGASCWLLGADIDAALLMADTALYRAKQSGKGCTEWG